MGIRPVVEMVENRLLCQEWRPNEDEGAAIMEEAGKKTVLVADDDENIRKIVVTLLKRRDFNVLVAQDGKQALTIARRFRGEIQILLTDIEMPGMTGIELANQIQLERPRIKVMLMSGSPAPEPPADQDWLFISKPFQLFDLMQWLT